MVAGSDNSTETVLFVCLRVCFYLASLCHLRSVSLSFVETALLLHGTMLRSSSVNLAWGVFKTFFMVDSFSKRIGRCRRGDGSLLSFRNVK